MPKIVFYTQTYNSENFLRKSIESVLNQSFGDFVYYISDDGSTDSTREIIKEYAKKDKRIVATFFEKNDYIFTFNETLKKIYISCENFEYLSVLDSDNWYETEFLEDTLNTQIKTNSDLICVSSQSFKENSYQKEKEKRVVVSDLTFSKEDFKDFLPFKLIFFLKISGKLFKLDILKENNIFLNSDYVFGAGATFVFEYLKYTNQITIKKNIHHNYLLRDDSLTSKYNKDRLDEIINLYEKAHYFFESTNMTSELNFLFVNITFIYYVKINLILLFKSNLEKKEKNSEFKKFITCNHFLDSLRKVINSDFFEQLPIFQNEINSIKLLLYHYTKEFNGFFDENLYKVLNILISEINTSDFKYILKNDELIENLISKNYEICCEIIVTLIENKKDMDLEEYKTFTNVLYTLAKFEENEFYLMYSLEMSCVGAAKTQDEDEFNFAINEYKKFSMDKKKINGLVAMYQRDQIK